MNTPGPDGRDDATFLAEFAERHRPPRARDVLQAQKLRPHLAAELRDIAIRLNEAAFRERVPPDRLADDVDVDRVFRALEAAAARADSIDLADLIARAGMTVAALADTIAVPSRMLERIADGACLPPLSRHAVATLAETLNVAPVTLAAAAAASAAAPRLGMSRSASEPAVLQRTFAEIVAESGMSEELQAIWLAD